MTPSRIREIPRSDAINELLFADWFVKSPLRKIPEFLRGLGMVAADWWRAPWMTKFKDLSLVAIVLVGAWLLAPAPPPEETAALDAATEVDVPHEEPQLVERVGIEPKYEIRFDPGFYMPGRSPMGVGDELTGFFEVMRDFERLYPEVKLTLVQVPAGQREYLTTQLSSGQAPEIVQVNVEDVWIDIHKGWYLPLDRFLEQPNPYVEPGAPGSEQWWDMFKYQAISRGKAAPDGRNYCISFDMIETAIFYNKDLFREFGFEVPELWEELIEILDRVDRIGERFDALRKLARRDSPDDTPADHAELFVNLGLEPPATWEATRELLAGDQPRIERLRTIRTPIQMVEGNYFDWCLDLMFDQLYYGILPGIDLYQDERREGYLEGYLDWFEICHLFDHGFFTDRDPRYRELWRIMHDFRQYSSENISNVDTLRAFITQRAAMMWTSSQISYRLHADPERDFDWGIFYLPRFTKETTQYASGEPMCVIGGSAMQFEVTNSAISDTGDPDTSEKLDYVIKWLQYITTPRNYERVVNERPLLLPNIVGVPVLPLQQPFDDILARRYTTTKWIFTFDLKFNEIQNRILGLYLNDGIDMEKMLEWFDGNITNACSSYRMRKEAPWDEVERQWREKADLRARYKDLPTPPETDTP